MALNPRNILKGKQKPEPQTEAEAAPTEDDLAGLFARATSGKIDASVIKSLTKAVRSSLKLSKSGIGLSGKGMAELMLRIAPRIRINSAQELSRMSGGMTGESLAGYQVKRASRHSAAIGALAGGLASAGILAPPVWIMFPAEVLVETLLIASVEMKLVGELHEIYGKSITGTPEERGAALLRAWSERTGFDPDKAAIVGIGSQASKGARDKLIHLIRRRLLARAARNVSTIAPLLIGAAAAAEINRRATSSLGNALVADLGHSPSVIDTKIIETETKSKK